MTSIIQIKVDGEVLDPSLYRIDDWRYLVRLPDPEGVNPGWKCCQSLDLPDTEPDTWSVEYTYGTPPPPAGVAAAKLLACQLALACTGSEDCELPSSITSITRQGVTMLLLNPGEFFGGRTGLYQVDLFLTTYNPSRGRGPARISTPDIPRYVRRAGT